MQKRFVSIWFRSLTTDWWIRRHPYLKEVPFVLVSPYHGRTMIIAANGLAQQQGVDDGMLLADARALIPSLQFFDGEPDRPFKLLKGLAEWCIRFTPGVAIHLPDGLLLDATGCAHLWGGEKSYIDTIAYRLGNFGYGTRVAMADTIGAAWAFARFGNAQIVEPGKQTTSILSLPPIALRIEGAIAEQLNKLGIRQISNLISLPSTALRRRFGMGLLQRLHQAMGLEEEFIQPVSPVVCYQERLPCLEPISRAGGIEIALTRLLDTICLRLQQEEKGLRIARFFCCRVDGKIQKLTIGTNRASSNPKHIFKLFEDKISTIEPGLGIELFILEAPVVEALAPVQEKLFENNSGMNDRYLAELLDRIGGKVGVEHIHRYVPDEHYWPERSYKLAATLNEKLQTGWKVEQPRPLQLLRKPQPIEVTAPVPDYPPMLFRYNGKLHKVTKADGPERIESEWWIREGQHRDYYYVEDEEGHRYWLFRLGHYDDTRFQWFIHGFFS